MFRVTIICVCLLIVATDVVQCRLQLPVGFTLHQVTATWKEASEQCESEGAILASPTNEAMLVTMKYVMEAKRLTYHIGTRARNTPGKYVSFEGIPLENMTVVMSDMVQQLDRSHGDCLSMDLDGVRVIPCWTELPYICYNPEVYNIKNISCGPTEQEYKYEMATDSCYKLHKERKSWIEAQLACVAEGAHLAVIETADEAEILKKLHKHVNNGFNIYIGLRDFTGNGDWMSVNWQRVEELYNVWLVGYKPARSEKIYGVLSDQGPLDDVSDEKRSFICEKRPVV